MKQDDWVRAFKLRNEGKGEKRGGGERGPRQMFCGRGGL